MLWSCFLNSVEMDEIQDGELTAVTVKSKQEELVFLRVQEVLSVACSQW
jgi:hypothetical protein